MTSNVTVTTGNAVTNISVSTGGGKKFVTFATDSGSVIADALTDTITLTGAGGLTTSGNDTNDTVTITQGPLDISSNSVGELSDVDITTSAPTSNQILLWNGTKFVPGDVSSGAGYQSVDAITDLNDHSSVGGYSEGQVFVYDASFPTQFVNRTLSGAITLDGDGVTALNTDTVNDTHIDFGTGANQVNTDDLPQGSTNLYYADSLVDAHLTGGTGVTYTTGTIAIGQDVGTTADVTFNTVTATTQFEGDLNGAILLQAKNVSGGTIYKGQAVYVNGLSGDTPTVILADASDPNKMPALGVAQADINNNATGEIVTLGNLYAIDTSASNQIETGITLSVGDVLYISATEPGNITNVAPTGESNQIQNIGKAVRVAPNTNVTYKIHGAGRSAATPALDSGNIFIGNVSNQTVTTSLNTEIDNRVANTSITALTDVTITTPSTGQVLKYDGANWVNGTDEDNLSNNTTTDLAEGTNLYYTDTRSRAAISLGTAGSQNYDNLTGVLTIPGTTDHITEGTNLYYTQSRFDTAFSGKTTTDLTEGTNLYYTTGRFDTAFSGKSTTDLSEGTNLYYTDARSRSAISLGPGGTQNYNSTTGVFTIPGTTDHIAEGTNLYYTDGRFDTRLATKTTADLTEGTNLYFTDARARAVSIENVVEDTTPQLGGDLDVNGQKLVTTSNGNIILEPNGTGEIRIDSDVVEQYSSKGHIITNYTQGNSPDLTSQGADFGTVYGKGIDIQADGSYAAIDMWSHKSNTGYPNIWAHRNRDDGAGNKDYLNNGDRVFNFLGSGWGGGADTPANFYGAFAPVGEFILVANEDHSASARGGKWQFRTTSTGSTSSTTKMEIGDEINALTAIMLDEVSTPTTTTDKGWIYAKDVAGTAEVFVKDAAGNETQISPHNEAGEWQYFSRNTKTGKTVRVNMEKMIRKLEEITGETFIENE